VLTLYLYYIDFATVDFHSRRGFERIIKLSPLQKLTTEHTEHTEYTERVRFMNKRIIFGHQAHVRKNFTALFFL